MYDLGKRAWELDVSRLVVAMNEALYSIEHNPENAARILRDALSRIEALDEENGEANQNCNPMPFPPI